MFVYPEYINELKSFGVPLFLTEVATALWLLFKGPPTAGDGRGEGLGPRSKCGEVSNPGQDGEVSMRPKKDTRKSVKSTTAFRPLVPWSMASASAVAPG